MKNYKPKSCLSCGIEFKPRGSGSLRCDKCGKLHEKSRVAEYGRRWRERNLERELRRHRAYYYKNREQYFLGARLWRAANPEKYKEQGRRYRQSPKGRANERQRDAKRRARLKLAICDLTAQEWEAILTAHEYRCAYCGKKFDLFRGVTVDHVIPISKGGNHTKENVVPACISCNARKGAKYMPTEPDDV